MTHNLSVVAEMCDRVMVMYAGRIVEDAPVREIFANPQHPYTKQLLKAIPAFPRDGRRLHTMTGAVPDLTVDPDGCAFAPRCEHRHRRTVRHGPSRAAPDAGHRAGAGRLPSRRRARAHQPRRSAWLSRVHRCCRSKT